MRLLTLAVLAFLHPQDPPTVWRRPFALMNRSSDTLPAGVQVAAKRPGRPGGIAVLHGGKPVATWTSGDEIWFRTAAAIKGYGRDEYEIRYGGLPAGSRPADVFEFFDEPGEKPDPGKWKVEQSLSGRGLAISGLSEPGSVTLLSPLPADFVLEADLRWEIREGARVAFAVRIEVDEELKVSDETRRTCAGLIARLGDDDIETRESALRDLIRTGRAAVPQLLEASKTGGAETRARAEAAIARIHAEDPPQEIRCGFSADSGRGKHLLHTAHLGASRNQLQNVTPRTGEARISIQREETGTTYVSWPRTGWTGGGRIRGRIGRVRFDFSGDPDFGVIEIRRVLLRRYVDLPPEAVYGAEEVAR